MSIHPQTIEPVPAETARIVRLAFPKGNRYLTLRDEIGTLYTDQDFTTLFSSYGQTAIAPWRLALTCLMQFIEDLTDRQAAEAVQSRIDWKCALGLELTDPGFDLSVLSEFRDRLMEGQATQKMLDKMLEQFEREAETQKQAVLGVAHSENVSGWTQAISRWLGQQSSEVSWSELEAGLGMPWVELWLGLLLGGFRGEQRGGFYQRETIWVEAMRK